MPAAVEVADVYLAMSSDPVRPVTTFLVVGDAASGPPPIHQALLDVAAGEDSVVCAPTVGAARRALAERSVDCVLLDLSLPEPRILEAVGILRAAAPYAPIVVVQAEQSTEPLAYAALAGGADANVRTTADAARLRDAIAEAVRHRGEAAGHDRAALGNEILDSIDAPTAALDGTGHIIAVNRAWRDAARIGGAAESEVGVGVNYLAVSDMAVGDWSAGAAEAAEGIRSVLRGDAGHFCLEYPCPSGGVPRWFTLRVTPLGARGGGAVVTHLEITTVRTAEAHLQQRDVELHALFDESAPIFVLVDAGGEVRHISEHTRSILGLEGGEPPRQLIADRLDHAGLARATDVLERVLTAPMTRERFEVSVRDGLGRWRDLDLLAINLLHDPNVEAVAIAGADVTERRRAQITDRLESRLLGRLPASVIVCDDRGVVVYWNNRAAEIFGHDAESALGRCITDLRIGPADRDEADRIIRSVISTGRWEGDHDARRSDGVVVPVYTMMELVHDELIGFRGFVAASIDITERRQLEADLVFQASHDPLTSLPNRRMLVEHLDDVLDRNARRGSFTGVLFIDLDDFKGVNDSIGHAAADEVLRAVGRLIAGVLREGDVVGRLGGDEFVVCCDDVADIEEARGIAERIRTALRGPFGVRGQMVTMNASIGVAVAGTAAAGDSLLRNADAAMYAAKEAGKSRVELFDEAMHDRLRARRQLATELACGIEKGELVARFQPEIDLRTGRTFGFEALARWHHPSRGVLAPDEFIPLAEETGQIGAVSRTILEQACRALAAWTALDPESAVTVSVNIAPVQLADPGLASMVHEALVQSGVVASRVILEVTESALMDEEVASHALRALRATGVKIAIDDFGTGYSSLTRLKRFSVDYLKIDRAFVAGLGRDPEDELIVSAVVNLGRSLGLSTIAEGIEDEAQLLHLARLGCELGQGFLWSEPVDLPQATALLAGTVPFAPVPSGNV